MDIEINETAEAFYQFYKDLFENHREQIGNYLSENIVFHWFGHTVKGSSQVSSFTKANLSVCQHYFDEISPTSNIDVSDNSGQLTNLPSTSSLLMKEQGQGDGIHNNAKPGSPSVVKRIKLECESGYGNSGCSDSESSSQVRYIHAEGAVEFQKGAGKKLRETKWRRPCKLNVAYTVGANENYRILYIIYEANVKCRRNLLSEFSAEEPED